jgi:hypothetical protein
MPPRHNGGKFMFTGPDSMHALLSNYLSDINIHTIEKSNVKNVEDIQQIVGYFNHVIADIQAKKKKM